jgi:hypothetical protein
MNSPRLIPRPDGAPDSRGAALAVIYRRAIERYQEVNVKEGGSATAPADARKDKYAGTQSHST